jgi:hypothetical protein
MYRNLEYHILYCAIAATTEKNWSSQKIRNNKEEHIRSTWSSLLPTSLLTKGIHAEKILEYGWYIGILTHII